MIGLGLIEVYAKHALSLRKQAFGWLCLAGSQVKEPQINLALLGFNNRMTPIINKKKPIKQ